MIVRMVAGRTLASIAASTTRVGPVQTSDQVVSGSTESQANVIWRTAATISNFYVRVTSNDRASSTFRIRKNTANGNGVIVVGASATGEFEDTTNSDSIAAGDNVCYNLVTGAGGTTFIYSVLAWTVSSDVWFGGQSYGGGTQVAGASVVNYYGLAGDGGNDTTENRSKTKFAYAGTLKNLYVNINTNGRSTTTNVRSRKNTANGNLLIAIGAGVTGVLEDTANSDTIAVGDLVNLSITNGTATGTIAFHQYKVEFASTTGWMQTAHRGAGTALGAGATIFSSIGAFQTTATESNWQTLSKGPYIARRLQAFISANATTGGSASVRFRKNAANGNQLLSPGAGTTGFFEDTTNTDTFDVADVIDVTVITGTGGNTTYRLLAVGLGPADFTAERYGTNQAVTRASYF